RLLPRTTAQAMATAIIGATGRIQRKRETRTITRRPLPLERSNNLAAHWIGAAQGACEALSQDRDPNVSRTRLHLEMMAGRKRPLHKHKGRPGRAAFVRDLRSRLEMVVGAQPSQTERLNSRRTKSGEAERALRSCLGHVYDLGLREFFQPFQTLF